MFVRVETKMSYIVSRKLVIKISRGKSKDICVTSKEFMNNKSFWSIVPSLPRSVHKSALIRFVDLFTS